MTLPPQQEYIITEDDRAYILCHPEDMRTICRIMQDARKTPAPAAPDKLATVFNFGDFDNNAMKWLKTHDESIAATIRNQTLDKLRKMILEDAGKSIPSDSVLNQHLQLGESHAYGKCLEYIESLRTQEHERGDPR